MPITQKPSNESSPRFWTGADLDANQLQETLGSLRIAVVGYGNQGRAQAINLRDSGATIRIGNLPDDYAKQATADGFEVVSIAEASAWADVLLLLIPDEVMAEVFERDIRGKLRPKSSLCFASGYAIAFGDIVPPTDCDLLLLAPRMIGRGVRDRFEKGDGFFSFAGVECDASGHAWNRLFALAHGIGTLRRGILETSFRTEAELDLFNEQAFGPAFGRVLLGAMQTLLEAGYSPEAVLLEIYLSGEFAYICEDMAKTGLIGQLKHHSPTSQYGAISRGIKFLGVNIKRPMRKVLATIRSGGFAREWRNERRLGQPRFRLLRALALRQPIGKLENSVRKRLNAATTDGNANLEAK